MHFRPILNDHSNQQRLTAKPPMGWNSFNSYSEYLYHDAAIAQMEAMAKKLKPLGYEYFVIDNGWFAEYKLIPGTRFPAEHHAEKFRLDEFGRFQPSQCYFPHGFKPIIDRAHELGLKFGIHIMRGISREAVKQNLPIFGSRYRAADIANTQSICRWCAYNYGVDMNKPGAQDFYDAWIGMLAEWGVDFIKADDITAFPDEIKAVAKAIKKSGRPIVLSLSPGGDTNPKNIEAYHHADMLRTTKDIWDNRISFERAFDSWYAWQNDGGNGFWPDLDMLALGHLRVMVPPSAKAQNEAAVSFEQSGEGSERHCALTKDQQYTFITIRALAASPLFMGGDLVTSDAFTWELITNLEMIACNQNGIVGKRIYQKDGIEVWFTPRKENPRQGWIGIFNRNEKAQSVSLEKKDLSLPDSFRGTLKEIWTQRSFDLKNPSTSFEIPGDGVLFFKMP